MELEYATLNDFVLLDEVPLLEDEPPLLPQAARPTPTTKAAATAGRDLDRNGLVSISILRFWALLHYLTDIWSEPRC
jgi:hypothetical protein